MLKWGGHCIFQPARDRYVLFWHGKCPIARKLTCCENLRSLPDYFSICGTKKSSRNWLIISGDSFHYSARYFSINHQQIVLYLCREMLKRSGHCIYKISPDRHITLWQGKCPDTWNLTSYTIPLSLQTTYLSTGLRNLLATDSPL